MSAEEFVLIPKSMFMRNLSSVEEITYNPAMKSKANQLSFLTRIQDNKHLTLDTVPPSSNTEDIASAQQKKDILKELTSLSSSLLARSDIIYDKILAVSEFSLDHAGHILYRGEPSGIEMGSFLNSLQVPNKRLTIDEQRFVRGLKLGEHLVANSQAKSIAHERAAPQETSAKPRGSGKKRKTHAKAKSVAHREDTSTSVDDYETPTANEETPWDSFKR